MDKKNTQTQDTTYFSELKSRGRLRRLSILLNTLSHKININQNRQVTLNNKATNQYCQ